MLAHCSDCCFKVILKLLGFSPQSSFMSLIIIMITDLWLGQTDQDTDSTPFTLHTPRTSLKRGNWSPLFVVLGRASPWLSLPTADTGRVDDSGITRKK